jgi:hypothetical protein
MLNSPVPLGDSPVVPALGTPDPNRNDLRRLSNHLNQIILRLRQDPRLVLFGLEWNCREGLNGEQVNNLATSLGRGPIFLFESNEKRRVLHVHHPDSSEEQITWTVWSGELNFCFFDEMLTTTIQYLQAWVSLAVASSPPPTAAASGIEKGEKKQPPTWNELADSIRAALKALSAAKEPMRWAGIGEKSGYDENTLRQHSKRLQEWGFIAKVSAGFIITEAGRAIVRS